MAATSSARSLAGWRTAAAKLTGRPSCHGCTTAGRRAGSSATSATNHQALQLYRDVGNWHGQAETLDNLGGLPSRTAPSQAARNHHSQALAIARDIGAPLEEARALEGIGRCHLHDGNPGEGIAHLQQALTTPAHRSPGPRLVPRPTGRIRLSR